MIRERFKPVVFFDIDETLIDQRGAERHAAEHFWAAHRERLPHCGSAAELARQWRRLREKHAAAFFSGEATFTVQRRRRVREMFAATQPRMTDAEADDLFAAFAEPYRARWRLFEDVPACLAAVRDAGCRMGVISNGDGEQQRRKLVHTGIHEYFDLVVISGDVSAAKPQAAIFEAACAMAGADPCECVHIGDRHDADAQASAAAGLRGIWLDRLAAGPTRRCERITTLAHLPALLRLRAASVASRP